MENVPTPTFSVSEFLASINQTLEYAYPAIEVEGEVAGFKVNQNKWVFFDLKDAGASIGCFMSVWQLRQPIEDGMTVVVRAVPKVTQWGKFSLTIQSIRPKGEGSLKKSFDLLVAKLDKEGLFAPERKRALPSMPGYIGVISSTQAAGYADFIKIIDDRWSHVRVDVAHVQVQGEGAADQIIRAIRYFNESEELPEVLVIIRGGGSADDLSTFNDEQLAREIAGSRIPTLVGVGHEVDETLADMVADVRAATPSNAAQIVVPDRDEVIHQVRHTLTRAIVQAEVALMSSRRAVDEQLRTIVERIDVRHRTLHEQMATIRGVLTAYDPMAVLRRGYAIVRGEASIGSHIEIERTKDIITAEVLHVTKR